MSIQLNTAVVVIFSLEAPYLECFQSLGGTNFAYRSAFAPDLWSKYSTKAAPANAARVRACA
ncbi:hypothetical protein OIU79_023409 [Salix purpurea]|uniref:Uncharacterized protein n=1 Tax=Salix purpurea TaxID=77065 RepID=A0A9Q0W8Q5_SALPP|nr:hypothetical protein OIU79_023409 [Salix purpurea]